MCESTEGAMYSFDEVLGLLSTYEAKSVRSVGTKYQMKIGDIFTMPIVMVIMVKQNKPDLFKFKRVRFSCFKTRSQIVGENLKGSLN